MIADLCSLSRPSPTCCSMYKASRSPICVLKHHCACCKVFVLHWWWRDALPVSPLRLTPPALLFPKLMSFSIASMLQSFGNILSVNMITCFVLIVVVLVTCLPTVGPLYPLRQHFLFPPNLTALLSCRRMLLWYLMIPTNRLMMTSQLHRFGSMIDGVCMLVQRPLALVLMITKHM